MHAYKFKGAAQADHIFDIHPALFYALQILCERQGIAFRRVGIGDEGLDADSVDLYANRNRRCTT